MKFKTPKKEKVFEAITAVVDKRIKYADGNRAQVYSSDRSKFYNLYWSDSYDSFFSDDNASKWQNTLGYPILAILLDRGAIGADVSGLTLFSDVNWSELNKKHKRDYAAAVQEVLQDRVKDENQKADLLKKVDDVFAEVESLNIEKLTRAQ